MEIFRFGRLEFHWSPVNCGELQSRCSIINLHIEVTAKRKHDIAYSCFLVPWAVCLIAATVPTDIGTVGFLVVMPLTLASLAAIPLGVFYSIKFWRDGGLPVLAVLTIMMIALVLTATYDQLASGRMEDSFGARYGMLLAIIGILVVILEGSWFLLRRRRLPDMNPAAP
jgi:hypothetical protein